MSSASELPYPISVFRSPRYWTNLLSVLDFDIIFWIKTGVSSHEYLIVLDPMFSIHHNIEGGVRLCFCRKKVRDRQEKPVIAIVLFCVVKEILSNRNSLVSIFLRLLNCYIQMASYGFKDIEQNCWLWLICDLNSWIKTGVISQEWLLILDPEFLIQK